MRAAVLVALVLAFSVVLPGLMVQGIAPSYPVVISVGGVDRVFFAPHTNSLVDGNWIGLSGGTTVDLPSISFVYDGPDIDYTKSGVTVTVDSDSIPPLTYPLGTHQVYKKDESVSATFWGSTDFGDEMVSFMLLQLSSLSEIKDVLDEGFLRAIETLLESQVWIQPITLDSTGDGTIEFDAPDAGDYILVVAKIDIDWGDLMNSKIWIYSATVIEVVDYTLEITADSSVKKGDSLYVNSKLGSEPSGYYTHVAAMIKESEYKVNIILETDGDISSTNLYINGKVIADGNLFTDFYTGTKDQSDLTLDFIEKKLKKAFDSNELAFGHTPATYTGTISLSTSSLTPDDYVLLVGVWRDWDSRIVGLEYTTVTVTEYVPPPPLNKKPVADAGPDQMVYVGETILLDGSGSHDPDGSIVSYEWDFGDGDIASGVEVSHSYSEPDSYTVTLTVRDNKGKVDTDTCLVTVNEAPPETGTLSVDTEPVKGEVFVEGESWGTAPQVRELEIGLYDISFGAVDGYVTPDSVEVEVKVDETTDVLGTYVVIPQDMGVLNIDTEPVKGEVFVDDISWGIAPQSQVVEAGTYSISFGEVTGYVKPEPTEAVVEPGLTTDIVGTYTEITEKQPPVADAGGPYSCDRYETILLDGSGSHDPDGEIVSYEWDFGDGTTGTGVKPSHTYSSKGTFTVTLTVTDDDALTDSDTTTVKVSKPYQPPSPRPNKKPKADAGLNVKISMGSIIHFSGADSYDKDGKIVDYRWDFGDGTTTTGVEVSHTYTEHGHYTVTLVVEDNRGAEDSDKSHVKVWDPPVPIRNRFGELVPGNKKGHTVNAMEAANTTVTLNTTKPVTVTVLRYEENPHPEDPMPATALPIYIDVEVSNSTAVEWPIYVEMHYTDEEIGDLNESSFGIYYWMNGTWQRCSHTGVDMERNVVWAYMTAIEASGSPILIAGLHEIITPPLPPILSNLVITPEEVELGEDITISFDIMNPNNQSISNYTTIQVGEISLLVDIELDAYESKTVTRTLTPLAEGIIDVTVDGLAGSFTVIVLPPPPTPAEFVVSDLSALPTEIEEGGTVMISVTVTNIGETEGSYTVEFKVDGETVESETVTIPGDSVYFSSFEKTWSAGTYQVSVEDLTAGFTVSALPEPDFTIYYIVVVIIIVAIVAYWLWKQKLPPFDQAT